VFACGLSGTAAAALRTTPRPDPRGRLHHRRRTGSCRWGGHREGKPFNRLRPAAPVVGSFGTLGVIRGDAANPARRVLTIWSRPAHHRELRRPARSGRRRSVGTGDHTSCGSRARRRIRGRASSTRDSPRSTPPNWPAGSNRGRVSVAPGASPALARESWGGTASMHLAGRRRRRHGDVAAVDRSRARRGPRRGDEAHGGWLLREAGAAGPRTVRARRRETAPWLARSRTGSSHGKLSPGRLPFLASRGGGGGAWLSSSWTKTSSSPRVVRALHPRVPDGPGQRAEIASPRAHRRDARGEAARRADETAESSKAMDAAWCVAG